MRAPSSPVAAEVLLVEEDRRTLTEAKLRLENERLVGRKRSQEQLFKIAYMFRFTRKRKLLYPYDLPSLSQWH
ncbi:hypothetical protein RIF29_09111 [Crotalaria pallida]|uniref:Uncharacterized protein n=1 Tax=Crotalaria pallida TaxID=3830 RepID=A0AAN9FXS5_CROPI